MKTLLALAMLLGVARAEDLPATASTPVDGEASAAGQAPQPLDEPPLLPPPATDAETDAVTAEVSDGLRCPVCQGLSVNDSPADGARAMKARIRELVAMGYSREQIEDYFVARYGTWVLLAPPVERQHWAVYLAPVAFLVGGLGVIGLSFRARKVAATAEAESARAGSGGAGAPVDEVEDDDLEPYRQRVLAELGLSAPVERP